MSWFLSQIGRREDYRLAQELHRRRLLGAFYTDIWSPWTRRLPVPEKLRARYAPGLAGASVGSSGLLLALRQRLMAREQTLDWTETGRRFGRDAADFFRLNGISRGDVVLGYTCGNLEQLEAARDVGALGLHVQVDPGPAWYRTRQDAQAALPSATRRFSPPCEQFMRRIFDEMRTAKKVIVHSTHSRDCLLTEGLPQDRLVVIPPAFEAGPRPPPKNFVKVGPLRVLFLGYLCVSKGFHILADASRMLGSGYEFTAVGSARMEESYLNSQASRIRCAGRLDRRGVAAAFAAADVLVFPTLSDGFGLVQLEAMAAGLPVIATPNCGAVVEHGVSGMIVQVGNAEALAASLRRLHEDRDLLATMSMAARLRSESFTAEKHLDALTALVSSS